MLNSQDGDVAETTVAPPTGEPPATEDAASPPTEAVDNTVPTELTPDDAPIAAAPSTAPVFESPHGGAGGDDVLAGLTEHVLVSAIAASDRLVSLYPMSSFELIRMHPYYQHILTVTCSCCD